MLPGGNSRKRPQAAVDDVLGGLGGFRAPENRWARGAKGWPGGRGGKEGGRRRQRRRRRRVAVFQEFAHADTFIPHQRSRRLGVLKGFLGRVLSPTLSPSTLGSWRHESRRIPWLALRRFQRVVPPMRYLRPPTAPANRGEF
ncbi:hypothetical protein KM043_011425 [Ampulex compressa]|nr:hypothetical protein KM043_011425 [Ampulex compressa]